MTRFPLSTLAALAVCAVTVSEAFTPAAMIRKSTTSTSTSATTTTVSTTRLYISSFAGSSTTKSLERENPEENPVAYLKEPEAVEARSNVDGTIVVSGAVNDKDRQSTDQFLFDLLNHEESAFEFSTIKAVVNDVAWAKKRLLSRSARYTGLLDKLTFEGAASEGALPTAAQLEGAKSWVACVDKDHLATLTEIAKVAAQVPTLENVAVLLANANELPAAESATALESIKTAAADGDKFAYTVVVVGNLEETPEGKEYYQYESFGTPEGVLPAGTTFSREESYRMVTELLQLACGKNQALCFAPIYNANVTEARLIRGLRQAGYARPQEIDHMIREGPEAYKEYVKKWKAENPDSAAGYTTDAWWEADIYQQSRRKSAEREATKDQAAKDERTKEVEGVATEWAKREYFRQSMAGTIAEGTTEEEFIKQVWDRAMFEGDIKYRQAKGEVTDPDAELASFQARQERKKQTMLQRAKDELADILEEDGLSTDDLKKKWEEDEETMKDAGKSDQKGY
uniref:Uncharacterized protein n=1 Tax=Amphora coffeiformis TaxID=265554 RepID=A0A6S8IJY1_9STRA|eukprot:scaffold8005_cov275-Amphora_coffeaeformis.AAC.1